MAKAIHPDNSRAARYSLLDSLLDSLLGVISGPTGKIRISSHYNKKGLDYDVLSSFSNSS